MNVMVTALLTAFLAFAQAITLLPGSQNYGDIEVKLYPLEVGYNCSKMSYYEVDTSSLSFQLEQTCTITSGTCGSSEASLYSDGTFAVQLGYPTYTESGTYCSSVIARGKYSQQYGQMCVAKTRSSVRVSVLDTVLVDINETFNVTKPDAYYLDESNVPETLFLDSNGRVFNTVPPTTSGMVGDYISRISTIEPPNCKSSASGFWKVYKCDDDGDDCLYREDMDYLTDPLRISSYESVKYVNEYFVANYDTKITVKCNALRIEAWGITDPAFHVYTERWTTAYSVLRCEASHDVRTIELPRGVYKVSITTLIGCGSYTPEVKINPMNTREYTDGGSVATHIKVLEDMRSASGMNDSNQVSYSLAAVVSNEVMTEYLSGISDDNDDSCIRFNEELNTIYYNCGDASTLPSGVIPAMLPNNYVHAKATRMIDPSRNEVLREIADKALLNSTKCAELPLRARSVCYYYLINGKLPSYLGIPESAVINKIPITEFARTFRGLLSSKENTLEGNEDPDEVEPGCTYVYCDYIDKSNKTYEVSIPTCPIPLDYCLDGVLICEGERITVDTCEKQIEEEDGELITPSDSSSGESSSIDYELCTCGLADINECCTTLETVGYIIVWIIVGFVGLVLVISIIVCGCKCRKNNKCCCKVNKHKVKTSEGQVLLVPAEYEAKLPDTNKVEELKWKQTFEFISSYIRSNPKHSWSDCVNVLKFQQPSYAMYIDFIETAQKSSKAPYSLEGLEQVRAILKR